MALAIFELQGKLSRIVASNVSLPLRYVLIAGLDPR